MGVKYVEIIVRFMIKNNFPNLGRKVLGTLLSKFKNPVLKPYLKNYHFNKSQRNFIDETYWLHFFKPLHLQN